MSEFTPGPWKLDKFYKANIAEGFSKVIAGVHNGKVVADWPQGTNTSPQEHHSNANLIAAAPDMYEALEELFNLLEEYQPNWYLNGHYKRALAALQKARGEVTMG
ncbi:MAG: hypothetical protein ACYCX4_08020 [Bacillota bacterium]